MGFKDPTPKQVRYHYKKITSLSYKLSRALHEAHMAGVLRYEDYQTQSPCYNLYEVDKRIEKCCEAQLAQAMRREIGYT